MGSLAAKPKDREQAFLLLGVGAGGDEAFEAFSDFGIFLLFEEDAGEAKDGQLLVGIVLECLTINAFGLGGVGFFEVECFLGEAFGLGGMQPVDEVGQLAFGDQAEKFSDALAIAETDDEGNRLDVVAVSESLLVVDVDLGEKDFAVACLDCFFK